MANIKAIQRRIKNRVRGASQTLFGVVSPGLENAAATEITRMCGIKPQKMHGGVEFDERTGTLFQANLESRIATRFLMRIGSFKATHFKALEIAAYEIPWELYLFSTTSIDVQVTTKKSKLMHKGAIAERIHSAIIERLLQGSLEPANPLTIPQKILVRVEHDKFVISIDSSGEALYKRGVKVLSARAPLRENLGAWVLACAGYDGSAPLIDPMCGTGTFSIEAAMAAKNIPPGMYRDFAFMEWPVFAVKPWEYMKNEKKALILDSTASEIFASDIDTKVCDDLKVNLKTAGLENDVNVASLDFFDIEPQTLCQEKGLVVLNPPWGKRMGGPNQSKRLYEEILLKLRSSYDGWQKAIIGPQDIFQDALTSGKEKKFRFQSGGGNKMLVIME